MSDRTASEPTLPAIHVIHLMDVVTRWDVDPDALLAELGFERARLALPGVRLPISAVADIVERARAVTGESALGFYLGMQMKISWHGFLGFAAMSASTVRESLELAERFAPTRTSALTLRLELDGDQASLVIEERAPLGAARDVIILSLVVGIWQIGNTLTGRMLQGSADFAFGEPDYFARFAYLGPELVRFSQPEHRLVFAAEILDLPLLMSDPEALALARRQCEREMDALDRGDDVAARVRANLRAADGSFRTVEQVAGELAMSPRTLKRRLADAGSSFSHITRDVRRDLAVELLAGDDSVDVIAEAVGYADAQSFARAFRRWTGMTPSAYRRSLASSSRGS